MTFWFLFIFCCGCCCHSDYIRIINAYEIIGSEELGEKSLMTHKLALSWKKKALRLLKWCFPFLSFWKLKKFLLNCTYAFSPVTLFLNFYSIIWKSDKHCLLSVCTSLIKVLNRISQAEHNEKINQHCWHQTIVQPSMNPSVTSSIYISPSLPQRGTATVKCLVTLHILRP